MYIATVRVTDVVVVDDGYEVHAEGGSRSSFRWRSAWPPSVGQWLTVTIDDRD